MMHGHINLKLSIQLSLVSTLIFLGVTFVDHVRFQDVVQIMFIGQKKAPVPLHTNGHSRNDNAVAPSCRHGHLTL